VGRALHFFKNLNHEKQHDIPPVTLKPYLRNRECSKKRLQRLGLEWNEKGAPKGKFALQLSGDEFLEATKNGADAS
jgi:hypothetical protein